MSILIRPESQSLQVARLLEQKILSGKLEIGSRLCSTRELAEKFGVGQRVIISAFDILQQKDLIVRMPRKGVCVKKNAATKDTRNLMLFAFATMSKDTL